MGPLISFWTSNYVCPGFQSHCRSPHLHALPFFSLIFSLSLLVDVNRPLEDLINFLSPFFQESFHFHTNLNERKIPSTYDTLITV